MAEKLMEEEFDLEGIDVIDTNIKNAIEEKVANNFKGRIKIVVEYIDESGIKTKQSVKKLQIESKEDLNKSLTNAFDESLALYVDGRDLDDALIDSFIKSNHFEKFKKDFLMLMKKAFHNEIIGTADLDGLFNRFRLEATEEELNLIISRAPKPTAPAPPGMKWAYEAESDEYILVPES